MFAWQIAIMGCIVNGPGEMADADFGYVGGAPGKIDLYVGKVTIPLLGCQNHVYEMESFTMLLSSSCAFGFVCSPVSETLGPNRFATGQSCLAQLALRGHANAAVSP